MAKFLFIYHGGKEPETQEEGEAMMAAWGAWFEAMPEGAVIDPGDPVGRSHTVSSAGHVENGGSNPATGYGIFEFENHEAACAVAAKNPIVTDESGSVEIAEIHHIPM